MEKQGTGSVKDRSYVTRRRRQHSAIRSARSRLSWLYVPVQTRKQQPEDLYASVRRSNGKEPRKAGRYLGSVRRAPVLSVSSHQHGLLCIRDKETPQPLWFAEAGRRRALQADALNDGRTTHDRTQGVGLVSCVRSKPPFPQRDYSTSGASFARH